MKAFKLHWLDGNTELASGETIADAFSKAGYGASAIKVLDWYEELNKSLIPGVLSEEDIKDLLAKIDKEPEEGSCYMPEDENTTPLGVAFLKKIGYPKTEKPTTYYNEDGNLVDGFPK